MENGKLSDAELIALAAIAQQDAVAAAGANRLREIQDYSPAYGEGWISEAGARLDAELRARGVLTK